MKRRVLLKSASIERRLRVALWGDHGPASYEVRVMARWLLAVVRRAGLEISPSAASMRVRPVRMVEVPDPRIWSDGKKSPRRSGTRS